MAKNRPEYLKDIVGQSKAKKVCKILINAAKEKNKALGHTLFSGPSGTGKTTFAKAMCNEMNSGFYEVNAATINSISKIKDYVDKIDFQDILFIDEIHGLPTKVSEWLYTVMEDFCYYQNGQKIELPDFTVIGATTLSGDLPGPLKGRFVQVQEFEEYNDNELSLIVEKILRSKNMNPVGDVCNFIAKVSRGIPRNVINNTEWFHDYAISEKMKSLSLIKYMKTLKGGGAIGIRQLASKLNMSESTIKNDVEPFLQQKGLVWITKTGRVLNIKQVKDLGIKL